jgi:hypothetical protein
MNDWLLAYGSYLLVPFIAALHAIVEAIDMEEVKTYLSRSKKQFLPQFNHHYLS